MECLCNYLVSSERVREREGGGRQLLCLGALPSNVTLRCAATVRGDRGDTCTHHTYYHLGTCTTSHATCFRKFSYLFKTPCLLNLFFKIVPGFSLRSSFHFILVEICLRICNRINPAMSSKRCLTKDSQVARQKSVHLIVRS